MSYQVLARKWRPKSFEELVGQEQTARALSNALETQRLHHAYLFTGTRGVGKTTIARILSKSLNCELGITAKPCGTCSSCTEIDQGRFVDLMEIDAASKTKVEDTRELLENVQYRPTRGRYKVYLIDEVHMLSGHSFNALLKTLEEPPPHVIFLLATTDPQKLPVTVLSRCLQFHLKRMEEYQIIPYLNKILNAESLAFEESALIPIAKGADGSMRDALSLLDQAIAFCGDKIETKLVLEMLGSIDQSYCFDLLNAIIDSEPQTVLSIIENMSQYSPNYAEVMSDWLTLMHKIAVTQAGLGFSSNADQTKQYQDKNSLASLANRATPESIQLYYQLALVAKKDLAFAPHPRQGFEMAFLRILAFKPQSVKPVNSPTPTQSPVQTLRDNHYTEDSNAVEKKNFSESVNIQDTQTFLKPKVKPKQNPKDNSGTSIDESAINKPFFQDSSIFEKLKGSTKISETTNQAERKKEIQEVEKVTIIEELKPKIAVNTINKNNWHLALSYSGIEGNGLQVLLNSLAEYQNNELVIRHLPKVEHFLTESLNASMIQYLQDYFDETNLTITLKPKEELVKTPRDRKIKRHEDDIEIFCKELSENLCVAKLQSELGAVIDRQTIDVKSQDF